MYNLNEVYIVWEITKEGNKFSHIYLLEEGAKKHVEVRLKSIKDTEMDGREVYYKKYVVLE